MPRIRPVTINEFTEQLKQASEVHLLLHEPIPEMYPENVYKVETCLKTPFQTFMGKELYTGFVKKAAILFYLLIKNHPLANGNKRMAVLTLAYFSAKNLKPFRIDERQLYELALKVANSVDKDSVLPEIETFITVCTANLH